MKLLAITSVLLIGFTTANEDHCAPITAEASCLYVQGCTWMKKVGSSPAYCKETHEHISCAARTFQNCEDDDLCIGHKVKGVFTCNEVNLGKALAGEPCQYKVVQDDEGDYYAEVPEFGCSAGLICNYVNATNADYGVPMMGVCENTTCVGKKVPGNCNGNNPSLKDQCEAETQRVTICHRTCSEKNPWVRITIDEDAWNGEGCGHSLQHDIRDECANKAPWAAWGPNRKDYLIRFHGTRAEAVVKYGLNTKAKEKAYWRKWEPACPWVRNGACCKWNDTENPCCGIPPEQIPQAAVTPPPTPPPTVPPTPAPTKCTYDMGETDETICPGYDAVGTMGIKTSTGHIYPETTDPSDIFYDIKFGGTSAAPEVTFKIDNPFDYNVDMYVQYHKHPLGSTSGALDPSCILLAQVGSCNPGATPITVGCIHPGDNQPAFSLVSVFFRDDKGSSEAVPYQCCPVPDADVGKPLIEYTFKILCECPDSTSRHLRGAEVLSDNTLELWQQTVGTGR